MKTVSGKAFCKALERLGWTFQRVDGSHHVYYRPGAPRPVSVPVHGNKELRTGTQRALMRPTGLTDRDL
jgi:predicted RNA binding protein YcfA (HicA-like mRNA interferase family)